MDQIKRNDWQHIYIFLSILLVLSMISFGIVRALDLLNQNEDGQKIILNASQDELLEGKNFVLFDKYINVKELIKVNSDIETVSYFDDFLNKSVGYVNVFNGIGKDFLIVPGKEYEINVKRALRLSIN